MLAWVETLEARQLLTVNAVFNPIDATHGTLHIDTAAADNIVVSVSSLIPNAVLVNGNTVFNGGQFLLTTDTNFTDLDILATGNFANFVNLSLVTIGAFTHLSGVTVSAGDGPDTITGSEFGDLLVGGNGDDSYQFGGAFGADTVSDSLGNDALNLQAVGGDLVADLVSQSITTGSSSVTFSITEIDKINSGSGNDTLRGLNAPSQWQLNTIERYLGGPANLMFSGFETLQGGPNSDVFIINQTSTLTLKGGAGNDRFELLDGVSAATLDGEDGSDMLSYAAFTTPVAVNLSQPAATNVTTLSNVENVVGGFANDSLIGDSNKNLLDGKVGNDSLDGGGGLDVLRGGDGDDQLRNGADSDGQIGNDIIVIDTLLNTQSATDILLVAEMIGVGADLKTDGGMINLTGNVELTASVLLDTETGNDSTPGTVNFSGGTIRAQSNDLDLSIDTSTNGSAPAGPVTLTVFDNGGGTAPKIRNLTINATSGLGPNANLNLGAGIDVSNGVRIDAGAIVVDRPVTAGGDITLAAHGPGGDLTVNVDSFGGNLSVRSVSGNLMLFADGTVAIHEDIGTGGSGTITLTAARNIVLDTAAQILADNGGIQLMANQATPSASGNFAGILIDGSTITSNTGDVLLQAHGGDVGNGNHGVLLTNSSFVSGQNLQVNGVGGGDGSGNVGVWLESSGTITSGGGDVHVSGTGSGTSLAGSSNNGVRLITGGTITAGGTGGMAQVIVDGFGGSGTGGFNEGVHVENGGSTITSGGGDVFVTGLEGLNNSGLAISLTDSGSISTLTNGGSVLVSANSLMIGTSASISATTSGSVTLNTQASNVGIDLGAMSDPFGGPLSLSDAELDQVTAGMIRIGGGNSGTIVVSNLIDRSAPTNLELTTGVMRDIAFVGSNATLNLGTGNVRLSLIGNGSGGAITSGDALNDVVANDVTLESDSNGIGVVNNPLSLNAVTLTAMTRGGAAMFLTETDSVMLAAGGALGLSGGLSAGAGAIHLTSGLFQLSGSDEVDDASLVSIDPGAAFMLNGFDETLGGLTGGGSVINGSTTSVTLTLADAADGLFTGTLGGPGADDNNFGLTKTGAGTLTLSGTNTYSGSTLVTAGTLVLNGSIASDLLVHGSGTLAGSGTIVGTHTLTIGDGGTLAPGNSPGILNSGSVTFSGGSTFNVELNGTLVGQEYDQLNVTGTVNLNGATLNPMLGSSFIPAAGATFVILNNDGSDLINGTFGLLPQGSFLAINGQPFHIVYDFNSGDRQTNDVAIIANRSPTISAQSFFVSRTAANNSVVGTVLATDPDSAVTFVLAAGNTGNTFALDLNSGSLTVNDATGLATGTSFNLTVVVTDDADVPATAQITVTITNQAPSGADKTVTTNEDSTFTFAASDFGFSDPVDSPTNNLQGVKITTLPGAGSLTNNGSTFAAGQLISVTDINSGKLKFTPAVDANGTNYTSFTFQVQDDGGTAGSGVDLDPSPNTITFDVTPIADITDDSLTTNRNSDITANLIVGTNGATADTFENRSAAITRVTQGTNGAVSFAAGGTVTYSPNVGFTGRDSFTYTVTSGGITETASVTVTVNAVSDPPPTAPLDIDPNGIAGFDNAVFERALPGTRVGITLSATDPLGDNVFYRLTDDAGGRFAVDPVTGVVTVKAGYLLNAADATQHMILAQAVDATGNGSTAVTFLIDVIPVPPDALPTVSILPNRASVVEGNPTDLGNTFVSFTVRLNKPSAFTVQVDFDTRVGDDPTFVLPEGISSTTPFASDVPGPWDFYRSSGRLIFDPGITEQTVRVQLRPDDGVEPNELFFVELTSPVNVQLAAGQSVGIAQILDEDSVPQVVVEDVQVLEGDGPGQREVILRLQLTGDFAAGQTAATVDYSTGNIALDTASGDTDYVRATGTLEFTETTRTQDIHLFINGDLIDESDETLSVHFTNAVNLGLSREDAIVTILNDDSPDAVVSITPTINKIPEGNAGTQEVGFVVTLVGKPTTDVSVSYTTEDREATAGRDYVAASGVMTFTLADIAAGIVQKSIYVTVNGDTLIEPDEGFVVSLSLPTMPPHVSLRPDQASAQAVLRTDDQAILTEVADALFVQLAAELTRILNAGGGTKNNPALIVEMQRQALLIVRALGLTNAIVFIIDPVDFVVTDPDGRQSGYTAGTGVVNQIPGAYYSGDGAVELLIVPQTTPGLYNVQLAGLGGDFNASVTIVDGDRATNGIVNDFSGNLFTNGQVGVQVGNGVAPIPVGLGLAGGNSSAVGAIGVVGDFGHEDFRLALASVLELGSAEGFDHDLADSRSMGLMFWLIVSARVVRQKIIEPMWQSLGSPFGDLLSDGMLSPSSIPPELVEQFWSQLGQSLTGVPSSVYRLGDMLEGLLPTLAPRRNRSTTPPSGEQDQPKTPPKAGVKTKRSSLERPRSTPTLPAGGSGQAQPPSKTKAANDTSAQTPDATNGDNQQSAVQRVRRLYGTARAKSTDRSGT